MEILQATGHPKLLTVNTLTDSRKLDSVAIMVSVRAVDGGSVLMRSWDRRNTGETEHSTFEKSAEGLSTLAQRSLSDDR